MAGGSAADTAGAAAAASSWLIGLVATFGVVCLSGLAGISVEKALKSQPAGWSAADGEQRPPTLWERNVQLSLYGLLFGGASALVSDWPNLSTHGFLHGFSAFSWLVVLLAAGGGLIVAVVVKYTDTIVKGFATSLSIIATSVLSLLIFPGVQLSLLFWLGASCVLLAIFNYNEQVEVTAKQPPAVFDSMSVKEVDSTGLKGGMDEEEYGLLLDPERVLDDLLVDAPNLLQDVSVRSKV